MSDLWESLEASGEVVVPLQPRTAVYENPEGSIVIRQRSADFDDEADPYIIIRPELVPVIVRALLIEVGLEGLLVREYPRGPLLADPRAGLLYDEDDAGIGPKAQSSAERQRRYRQRKSASQGVTRDVTHNGQTSLLAHPSEQENG